MTQHSINFSSELLKSNSNSLHKSSRKFSHPYEGWRSPESNEANRSDLPRSQPPVHRGCHPDPYSPSHLVSNPAVLPIRSGIKFVKAKSRGEQEALSSLRVPHGRPCHYPGAPAQCRVGGSITPGPGSSLGESTFSPSLSPLLASCMISGWERWELEGAA